MSSNDKKTIISQEDIMKILDSCYEKMFKWHSKSKL